VGDTNSGGERGALGGIKVEGNGEGTSPSASD